MNFARLFDVLCAAVGLLILSPLLAVLALLILVRDGRPILFSQVRMGRYGIPFRIWKFRTMRDGAKGLVVTAAGDHRITANGVWLRRFKLDELPQLYNVLRGDMSLLGPRPEVPEYVNPRSPVWQAILRVRPGITDLATLLYRDEENLLACSGDADRFYREAVLPAKLRLNLAYIHTRSLRQDVRLIWLTIRCSLAPAQFNPDRIRKIFSTAFEYGG
ncbi:MAG TPA: sugar transferase [Bryobacteraceae bacterium]|jgi:lipopolysaccharide/colanic/teichoic acid biosynthesis glycosyltransferase|nr:sugar transferase [Bryobacteraceae bacterium]